MNETSNWMLIYSIPSVSFT